MLFTMKRFQSLDRPNRRSQERAQRYETAEKQMIEFVADSYEIGRKQASC